MKNFILSLVAIILIVPLLSISTSYQAHAATLPAPIQPISGNSSSTSNMLETSGIGDQYSEAQTMSILNATTIINKYISYNNGVLSLSEQASSKVAPFIYEYYKTGIDNIDNNIKLGYITLDPKNKTVLSNQSQALFAQSQGKFTANYSVAKYWWGVKWYLSRSESAKYQNMFADYAFGWGVIVNIFSWLGGPISALISGTIMAVGDYYLYTQLRDHTSSRGSVLVFKWTPPSAYAYRR